MIADAFASGTGNNPNALAPVTWGFVGATVTMNVASGQKVHAVSSKYMGSLVGASGLATAICYQSNLGGALFTVGGAMLGGEVAANTRIPWTASATFEPGVGSWVVGLCAYSGVPANWNSNEYGYTTALVFQP